MRTLLKPLARGIFALGILGFCARCAQNNHVGAKSDQLDAYRAGFLQLVDRDLRGLTTSKPDVRIYEIHETPAELSIRYDLSYVQTAADGEQIRRSSSGTALLKKAENVVKSDEWHLFKIRDARQTMSFTKGAQIGS